MADDLATKTSAGGWTFNEQVVDQFDTHVSSSVRGYRDIQEITARAADWLAPDNSVIADIGCSTATTFDEIQKRHPGRRYSFHGYDTSEHMLASANRKIAGNVNTGSSINLHQHDITNGALHDQADLTIGIFALQFLRPHTRIKVLEELLGASRNGGALLIAEKVIPRDSRWALIDAEASWEDKRVAGLPGEEIVAKAEALRGVLIPQLEDVVVSEALAAGWVSPHIIWAQWNWRLFAFFSN